MMKIYGLSKKQLAALGAEANAAFSCVDAREKERIAGELANARGKEDPFACPALISKTTLFNEWRRREIARALRFKDMGTQNAMSCKKISTMYLLISRASPGISKELFSLDLTTRETIVGRFLQTSKNRARNGNFCSRTIRRQFVFGSTVANSMQHLCNSSAEFFSRYVPDDEKHKIRHFQKSDTTIHENTLIEKSGSRKIFGSRRFFTRGPMSSFWILSALHIGIGNRCLAAQFHRSARTQSAVIFGHLLCFSAQHDARFHRSWGSL